MRLRLISALLLAGSASAAAQQFPREIREDLVSRWESDKRFVMAMIDSMPARLLRYKPVPVVRDFAQQMEHAAGANAGIVARFVLGSTPPAAGDTAKYLNDKMALKQFAAAAFDYGLQRLRELPDSVMVQTADVFGNKVPKWRVFEFAHDHFTWTVGAVVAYFRLNGMAPPAFSPF